MKTSTRKRWRGWLDRAASLLLAAAIVLQLSTAGFAANAADGTEGGGGQGTSPVASEPVGPEDEDWESDAGTGGPADGLTEENPAEEPPAEELPAEEPPAEENPAEEPPAEELPAEEPPMDEFPMDGLPAEQLPAEELPAEVPPMGEFPMGGLPAGEIPAGQIQMDGFPPQSDALAGVPQVYAWNDPLTVDLLAVQGAAFSFDEGKGSIASGKATVPGGNGVDYTPMLKIPVDLLEGRKYTVVMQARAYTGTNDPVGRPIAFGVGDNDYGGDQKRDLYGNIDGNNSSYTTLTFDFTFASDKYPKLKSDGLCFYLGAGNAGDHTIEISSLTLTMEPLADTPNGTAYPDIPSINGISPSDAFALSEGDWATDKRNNAQASFNQPGDGRVIVDITNSGTAINDVQFNKFINLKANKGYTLSFDVQSDKERSFNVKIDDITDGSKEGYTRPIAVEANQPRHVILQIPQQTQDCTGSLFSFLLGRYEGEPGGDNAAKITFSNIKLEIEGYRAKAELINDGEFTSGFGSSWTATPDANTTITVHNGSVVAKIAGGVAPASVFAAPRASVNTLSRAISNLETGAQYEVSFVAGAVNPCNLSVTLPNGESRTFSLTGDARPFSCAFTANGASGSLVFDFGTERNTICLDTVRLDVQGYAAAAGINTAAHDIDELVSQEPPVITEMANAVFGQTVRLKFPHVSSGYKNYITGITLDNRDLTPGSGSNGSVTTGDYYISDIESDSWHYIYLSPSLFTGPAAGSDRQTYEIVVHADYHQDSVAHQIVYQPNVFDTVTMEEDFTGTSLNTQRWGYQEGNGVAYGLWGWGNNELQWYTKDNVKVADGVLKITAGPCSHEAAEHDGSEYHSGRIWTKVNGNGSEGFSQTYGRFEAKIKLPAGEEYQGLWPAFWLLPAEGADYYGGWPVSGEIDIMEARCREPYLMDGTLHFGSPGNDSPVGSHYDWRQEDGSVTGSIGDYHIYSVDWTPTYISFQMDGHEYVRYDSWWSRAGGEPMDYAYPAPFDRPFYIILNMAVGGDYDGGRNPYMSALPADMLVDYVRVYQYKNLGNGIVPAPAEKVDTIPGTAKTNITDPNFTAVHKATDDTAYNRNDKNDWYLLTLGQFGGQANFSTTSAGGGTFLKVDVANGGSAAHAVQLVQHLELYEGNWYKLSFDAYADQPRDINAKIAADGTNSWSSFNESVAALGTELQHYEYTFQMRAETDVNSRLEINMGGAAGPVYIGNVTFEKTAAPVVDYDGPKTPLEIGGGIDSEGIYNGRFDLGRVDRLDYWNAVGGAVVKEQDGKAYEYRFKAGNSGATLTQKGIQLLSNDSYKLSAKVTGTVTYKFVNAAGQVIIPEATLLASQEIAVPAGASYDDAQVVFTLASGATLDDISLIRTTFNNVDYADKDAYPLFNGDFEAGTEGWDDHWNCGFNIGIENGSKIAVLSQYQGKAGIYEAGLTHSNVHLYGGYTYELSFKAKAKPEGQRPVRIITRLAGQEKTYTLGQGWETQTFELKPSDDMDTTLNFFFGAYEENGVSYNGWSAWVYLDDVEIKMKGAPAKPATLSPSGYNKLGDDVAVSISNATQTWIQKARPYLNGSPVSADMFTIESGKLVLKAGLFTEEAEYVLTVKADEFADARPVTIRIYPENGDLIFNGSQLDAAAWENYAPGRNSVIYQNGHAIATHRELVMDNGSAVPWGIQCNQKITAPAAGSYVLRFTADASVSRYIMVGTKDGEMQKIELQRGKDEYAVELNLEAGSAELQFWMGAVNPNSDNGYFNGSDLPFIPAIYGAPHTIDLSEVSLLSKDGASTRIVLTASEETVVLGGGVTITARLMDQNDTVISGAVTFTLDGAPVTAAGNTLTLTGDQLSTPGSYVVRAVYAGDGTHSAARKEITVTVTATAPLNDLKVESVASDRPGYIQVQVSGIKPDRYYLVRYGKSKSNGDGVLLTLTDSNESRVIDGKASFYYGLTEGMLVHIFEFRTLADTIPNPGQPVKATAIVSCTTKIITAED